MDKAKDYGYLRENLKSVFRDSAAVLSDQQKGMAPPALEKPYDGSDAIELPDPGSCHLAEDSFRKLVMSRRSVRSYEADPVTLPELSWLLWATQGVHEIFKGGIATRRTVPSAGARHAFETYIAAFTVEGLKPGIYRYLALSHKLAPVRLSDDRLRDDLVNACRGQDFCGRAAVTFIWTVIPYRSEWRYTLSAHRILLMDIGHVCQNMYLAAGAIGAGTCAVAAYDQDLADKFLEVDGKEEFTIYIAPVGKLK